MERKTKLANTTPKTLSNPIAQLLYDDLVAEGYPQQILKQEYANIARCSVSAVDHYMAKGYGIPKYRKMGHQKNARVLFSLRDVAEYLADQTVQTA